jgi:hypothetical protein
MATRASILVACFAMSDPRLAHSDDEGPPIDLAFGAGPVGFADAATRGLLSDGAGAELRFGIHTTRRWLVYELAYAASLHDAAEPEMSEGWLRGISFELGLRINLASKVFQPYVALGLGETYYRVTGWRANTTMAINDYVTRVPIGIGVTRRYAHTFVDLRATYRFTFDASLIPGTRDRLDTWNLVLAAGLAL